MKVFLKFDHTKKDALEAIDSQYDGEIASAMIKDIIKEYIENDDITKQSQLCELMHNKLDYEIILFLAMNAVTDKIREAKIEILKDELRKFLEDEDI